MSSIGYWLLARQSWNIFKPVEYLGYEGKTRDKKKAARWFSYEDAKASSEILTGDWQPILVLFDGDEPAVINLNSEPKRREEIESSEEKR